MRVHVYEARGVVLLEVVYDVLHPLLGPGHAGVAGGGVGPVGPHYPPVQGGGAPDLLHEGQPHVPSVRVLVDELLVVDGGEPGGMARCPPTWPGGGGLSPGRPDSPTLPPAHHPGSAGPLDSLFPLQSGITITIIATFLLPANFLPPCSTLRCLPHLQCWPKVCSQQTLSIPILVALILSYISCNSIQH